MSDQPSGPRIGARTLPPTVVAAATGLLVGTLSAGLVRVAMVGCDVWRGRPTCGGGIGLGALVAIVILAVLAGRLLLAFAAVSDPTMVSFLGVGLAMIAVMLVFLDNVYAIWMWLVMPMLAAATYAGSAALVRASGGTAGSRPEGR